MTQVDEKKDAGAGPKMRGWASLYTVAFILVIGAAGALAFEIRGFLASTRLLWVSTALSVAAIVLALLSLLLPRRS